MRDVFPDLGDLVLDTPLPKWVFALVGPLRRRFLSKSFAHNMGSGSSRLLVSVIEEVGMAATQELRSEVSSRNFFLLTCLRGFTTIAEGSDRRSLSCWMIISLSAVGNTSLAGSLLVVPEAAPAGVSLSCLIA